MITMDGALLEECGLQDLDERAQQELLIKLYSDLEYRVGRLLSDGMSAAQLDEFERIIDADPVAVDDWIARHAPDHETDPLFVSLMAKGAHGGHAAVRAEYAATAWLALNRPDYRHRVVEVFATLKEELTDDPIGTITRLQRQHGR